MDAIDAGLITVFLFLGAGLFIVLLLLGVDPFAWRREKALGVALAVFACSIAVFLISLNWHR